MPDLDRILSGFDLTLDRSSWWFPRIRESCLVRPAIDCVKTIAENTKFNMLQPLRKLQLRLKEEFGCEFS